MAEPVDLSVRTVRERLDHALATYLSTLTHDDLADLTVEAVAQEAGVSRATAYRYLGSREELLHRAAVILAQDHVDRCAAILARTSTIAARVEESFAYTVRETSRDALLQMLLHSPRSEGIDTALRAMSADLMAPAVRAGQADGQVRNDISAEELIDYLLEQVYVVERLGQDETETRRWVRLFVIPALRPPESRTSGIKPHVRAALLQLQRHLDEMDELVEDARGALE